MNEPKQKLNDAKKTPLPHPNIAVKITGQKISSGDNLTLDSEEKNQSKQSSDNLL